MLSQLTIRDFTLIDELDLEFATGLTVLTGETGAGKSIILDALALALGDRADNRVIRAGCDSAEIVATFDVAGAPAARAWLAERELGADDDCFLRRVISAEGRSRAWINGRPLPLQELKQLGELLVDLHGQHEHQSLLKRATHCVLLDAFGGHETALQQVQQAWEEWRSLEDLAVELRAQGRQRQERRDLLSYQLDEFAALGLETGEFSRLDEEQQRLANAGENSAALSAAIALCDGSDGDGIEAGLHAADRLLKVLPGCGSTLDEARALLESARIQVEEARRSLTMLLDCTELDPERLQAVEARLSVLHQLARKHRVEADDLPALQDTLQQELNALSGADERLAGLDREVAAARQAYAVSAAHLGKQRKAAAQKLSKAVQARLQELAMERCRFEVQLSPRQGEPHRLGEEQVEFLVATLPGVAPEPLSRVASGGELSRISLAIQVTTTATTSIPTLIFDEVDVGIGGATADTVGRLLRRLAGQAQVLCVTHLPQVAARGHHHLRVSKSTTRSSARAELESLAEPQRVEEIARMLGGSKVTSTSRDHAREMLALED